MPGRLKTRKKPDANRQAFSLIMLYMYINYPKLSKKFIKKILCNKNTLNYFLSRSKNSRAVWRRLGSCWRTAMASALRVPTNTASFLARVRPV